MTDTEIIDWLEKQARRSPTGISFDWIPSVEGERSGFRFMRHHFIGEQKQTLRGAIREAARLTGDAGNAGSCGKMSDARSDLTKLAAECHRAKWEFDLSEDYTPSRAVARALVLKAFAELHRIGDMALKMRDASTLSQAHREVEKP